MISIWKRLLFAMRIRCDRCGYGRFNGGHIDADGCFDCDCLDSK